MLSTTETFGQQIDGLTAEFVNCSGAFALFYWGDGSSTGLRVEVGFLGKEFVDKVEWGREPEGLIFYRSTQDFNNITGDVRYKVTSNCNTESPASIRVDFFRPNDDTRFCSFITQDTTTFTSETLAGFADDGSGQWRDHSIATSHAILEKKNTSYETTVTMAPIGKKISWDIQSNQSCDILGTLLFYKLTDITPGLSATADFNADRVLIHSDNTFYAIFYGT